MDAYNSANTPHPLNQGHFDQNNPLSLYSKMGEAWSKRFIDKLGEAPELAEMLIDETVLKPHLELSYKFCPTASDNKYRLQLWLEYENACKLGRMMLMSNVYNLVGPESTFHNLVMQNPCRVAWMLCKPVGYDIQTREILAVGLARLRGYLERDAFADDKKPNMQLARLQLDITKMMDLRQHGAPTQRIQEISVKGVIGANGEIQALSDAGDLKALEKRKQDLEGRRRKAEGRAAARAPEPETIDIEVVKEDEHEGSKA